MKNSLTKAFVGILFTTLFACDKIDELADVNFNANLSETFQVDATTTNEMTFSSTLDVSEDSDAKPYLDKIKNYEIEELKFEITNLSTSVSGEIYFDGVLGFSKKNETSATATCSVSPLNITHVNNTGAFEINNCDDILNDLKSILMSDNAAKIYMQGTFSKAPVTFDLTVHIKVKITANPL